MNHLIPGADNYAVDVELFVARELAPAEHFSAKKKRKREKNIPMHHGTDTSSNRERHLAECVRTIALMCFTSVNRASALLLSARAFNPSAALMNVACTVGRGDVPLNKGLFRTDSGAVMQHVNTSIHFKIAIHWRLRHCYTAILAWRIIVKVLALNPNWYFIISSIMDVTFTVNTLNKNAKFYLI